MEGLDISRGLAAFLEARGARSGEERLHWRRVYKRLYDREAKRRQREKLAQLTLSLPRASAEELRKASVAHSLPVSRYVADAALAYTRNTAVDTHAGEIAELRQALARTASDIRYMAGGGGRSEERLEALARRVDELEDKLSLFMKDTLTKQKR